MADRDIAGGRGHRSSLAALSGTTVLSGIDVVEVGTGIGGSAAGAVLGLLGATVRKEICPGQYAQLTERELALLRILDDGKQITEVSEDDMRRPERLRADIAIGEADTPGSPRLATAAQRTAYCEQVARTTVPSFVTISPYGLDGPKAGLAGGELAALASGGAAGYMKSAAGRPMKPAGYTATLTAGQFAALAGLHGLREGRRHGRCVHHDLAMQDVVVVTGAFLESAHLLFDCPGESGSSRYSAPAGLFACADGLINLVVLEDHQWQNLKQLLGYPEWAAGIETTIERRANADLIRQRFEEWSTAMPAKECAARLQAARVPATVVNTCDDLLADRDLRARGFFRETEDAGLRVPGLPAVVRPSARSAPGATAEGGARARNRVLDLSHVLAGPLGTAWLGAMGFDVVKVEDPARLDSYRRRGPFCTGINDPERSAYFSAVNFSKRGISLGYETPDGGSALGKLARDADFIVENLSATRAARVLPAGARAESSACLISSSGFGRVASERASWRAYGHNIHAHGGLVHLSKDRDGNPTDLGTAWADPLTAIWIALTVTAQSLLPAGTGFDVDLSMSEVVAFQFPDLLAAQQASGKDVQEEESRLPGYAPHGIFATSDGWLAVAVRTDEEWVRLVEALGRPPALSADGYRSVSGRTARQAELEAGLETVLRATDHATAVTRLQGAGLSCTSVLQAEDLITDPHLEHRGLFRPVRHPVCGTRRLAGLPWKIAGGAAYPITPPPTVGQHSEDLDDPWR